MKAEDKYLLQKFLEGHCSEKELAEVGLLLKQRGTDEVLDELITLRSGEEWSVDIQPDAEMLELTARKKAEAAERFGRQEKTHSIFREERTGRKMRILRYAAVWAGLLLTGSAAVWQYHRMQNPVVYVVKINPKGLPTKYVLPDQSEVYVGAGSKISYPENFNGDTRELDLEGEAFFQVKHDSNKPFIIHTKDIQTQVLGTSFKVEAFRNEPIIVSVATGKVGVSQHTATINKTLAMLTPGRQVIWHEARQQATERAVDVYGLEHWKAGELVFEEQSIAKITDDLERRFALKIEFADKEVAGHMVSVTFPASKPIEKMMHILSETGKFRYEMINKQTYKIYQLK